MDKDLFDYVKTPTANEYRKPNIIDKIAWIPKFKKLPDSAIKEQFINDAIINYNNEVVMAKTFYANMLKYRKYFERNENNEYDIWSRKYAEQVIKELFSIYDKSFHIINYLYCFNFVPDKHFNKNIGDKLKIVDKDFYDKLYAIFDKNSKNNSTRNDITHNFSRLFLKYKPKYIGKFMVGWEEIKELSYDEYKNLIDDTCTLLAEQRNLIVKKISEFYPKKPN